MRHRAPGLDVAATRHYREQRAPPNALDQVRIEADVTGRAVTVLDCRTPWREAYGPERTRGRIARFRYTAKSKQWTLYSSDRNLRWHKYDLIEPTSDVLAQLDELDRDPTCILGAHPPAAGPRTAALALHD